MDIKKKFIELTSRTYPHGHENDLVPLLPHFFEMDVYGYYFHQIGNDPTTMFTCHMDTASNRVENVTHEIKGNIISTNGKTILGADDKAGMVVLLYLIENNVKGLYYFFIGEERGCVGSRKLAQKHKYNPIESISKVISFDRRGTDSVITHQLGGRCCSEKFGINLSKELNRQDKTFKYETDPTGIYTDSAQFTDIYSECTNISVGYNYEHTSSEYQDIDHLERLCKACVKINWDELPIDRNIKDKYEEEDEYDPYDDYYYVKPNKTKELDQEYRTTYYFTDPLYQENFSVTIKGNNGKLINIELPEDRIDDELSKIHNIFKTFDVDYEKLEWDGNNLQITYNSTHTSTMYREELSQYIEEMDFWKSHIETKL